MHARRAAYAAVLLTAALTACSSNEEPKTITVTQTVTATPESNTQDEAGTANNGALKMGAKKNVVDNENDVHLTVQAIKYQQPYKGPQPEAPEDFQSGDTWATAEVKVCNVAGASVGVSQFPWSLTYKDGTSIDVTGSTGGDMPKPEFPMDKTLKAGRCAAGLIAFPVPENKTPEYLVYEPEGDEPTEWAIKP